MPEPRCSTWRGEPSSCSSVFDEAARLWECRQSLGVRALLPGVELVVKDAERPAVAVRGAERVEVAALNLPVVEPVGAGDAFAAGYLTADAPAGTWPERCAWVTPLRPVPWRLMATRVSTSTASSCVQPHRRGLATVTAADVVRRIGDAGVVPVLRTPTADQPLRAASTCFASGLDAVPAVRGAGAFAVGIGTDLLARDDPAAALATVLR